MQAEMVLPTYEELMGERCQRSFFYFVKEFWQVIIPEEPIWNWHIEMMCNEAQEVVERLKRREVKVEDILVNIPPGTTKSTIWSVMLPAWAWAVDPTLRILCLSYSEELALEFGVKSREIIEDENYRLYFPNVILKQYQNTKKNYVNTLNGQRCSAGIGGTITGKHFHLHIIDDPLNPKEAASEQEIKTANYIIDQTLPSRFVNLAIGTTAMVMQRLNENDPAGVWLSKEGKKIKHICLPAEVKDGVKPASLEKYYINGLLDPIRLNNDVLADMKINLGSAGYAGQYSQQPAPAKGLIWQRWFIEVPDEKFPDKKFMTQYGTDWDTAYTKEDDNAASAYMTAGKVGHRIYIDDFGWDWLEFPQLIKYMKSKASPHYIEAKASGKSSKQTLVQNGIIAIEIPVSGGDKIARANMATPVAEAGFVYIRKSMADKLYSDSKQGVLKFPRGKFKDLADVLAQCLQRLGKKKGISSTTGNESEEY